MVRNMNNSSLMYSDDDDLTADLLRCDDGDDETTFEEPVASPPAPTDGPTTRSRVTAAAISMATNMDHREFREPPVPKARNRARHDVEGPNHYQSDQQWTLAYSRTISNDREDNYDYSLQHNGNGNYSGRGNDGRRRFDEQHTLGAQEQERDNASAPGWPGSRHERQIAIVQKRASKDKYVNLFLSYCACLVTVPSNKYAVLLGLVLLNMLLLVYGISKLRHVETEIIHLQHKMELSELNQLTPEGLQNQLQIQETKIVSGLEWRLRSGTDLILMQLRQMSNTIDAIRNENAGHRVFHNDETARHTDNTENSQSQSQYSDVPALDGTKVPKDEGYLSFLPSWSLNFDKEEPKSSKVVKLRQELELLQENFPTQPRQTWIEIQAAVASTLEPTDQGNRGQEAPGIDSWNPTPQSERPAVIFVLQKSSEASTGFGSCFAKQLAKATSKVVDSGEGQQTIKYVDPNYFESYATVTDIHRDLETHLTYFGKIVVVSNVNFIQRAEHLYLFHSFCDNFVAPDPKAIFIFVSTISPEVETSILNQDLKWNHKNGNKIANIFLHHAWQNVFSEDKRAALISRVAPSVVLLQPDQSTMGRMNRVQDCQ